MKLSFKKLHSKLICIWICQIDPSLSEKECEVLPAVTTQSDGCENKIFTSSPCSSQGYTSCSPSVETCRETTGKDNDNNSTAVSAQPKKSRTKNEAKQNVCRTFKTENGVERIISDWSSPCKSSSNESSCMFSEETTNVLPHMDHEFYSSVTYSMWNFDAINFPDISQTECGVIAHSVDLMPDGIPTDSCVCDLMKYRVKWRKTRRTDDKELVYSFGASGSKAKRNG